MHGLLEIFSRVKKRIKEKKYHWQHLDRHSVVAVDSCELLVALAVVVDLVVVVAVGVEWWPYVYVV
jgi:hypothetical protein